MNIFYLDTDPVICAHLMSDRHVIKMILETAQILSTAHVVKGCGQVAYKKTHENHPSTLWAMEAQENYLWLFEHFKALIDEHLHRYPNSNIHKSSRYLTELSEVPKGIRRIKRTPIRLAMPELLKCQFKGTKAYQEYYKIYKRQDRDGRKPTWTNRPIPSWFNIGEQQ